MRHDAGLATTYHRLGLVETVTSWSTMDPEDEQAVVRNQVQKEYNASGQLIKEWQSHGGEVTSSTPKVDYGYEDGTDNTIRPTSLTYPSSRTLTYSYGDTEQLDHLLSRVRGITDDDETELAGYSYLGAGTVVRVEYPQPEVELTYLKQGAEGNGEAGDQYAALDRFGRILDQRWIQGTTALERLKYGYDHAGNRLWKQNLVAPSTHPQDELYAYDGLYQLKDLQRGTLNSQHSTINDPPAWQEALTYDAQGNWANYLTKTGGVTDLNQDRVHNLANEITEIASSAEHIAHDKAGNMTRCPTPASLAPTGGEGQGEGAAFELKWDAWNRLVQVSGIGPNGNETVQYAYDGQSRRITKTQGASVRHYYYSARWQVLEERVEDTEEEETILDRQYVWGLRHIDDLVLRDSGLSGTSTCLYGLHDHLSLTAVVNPSGVVQERYRYTAFGQKTLLNPDFTLRTSSTLDWETGFHCYRWDGETGLCQVRYRYLHPELGRWLARDPAGEAAGQNLVLFASNNVNRQRDSLGLWDQNRPPIAISPGKPAQYGLPAYKPDIHCKCGKYPDWAPASVGVYGNAAVTVEPIMVGGHAEASGGGGFFLGGTNLFGGYFSHGESGGPLGIASPQNPPISTDGMHFNPGAGLYGGLGAGLWISNARCPRDLQQTQWTISLNLAGTIRFEKLNTVWRACGDETKSSSQASTEGAPNGAAPN